MSSVTQIAPTPVAPVVTRPRRRKRLRKAGWNLLALLVLVVMVAFMFVATLVYLRQMLRTGEVY